MSVEEDFDPSKFMCKDDEVFVKSVFDKDGVVRVKNRKYVRSTDSVVMCDRCGIMPCKRIDHKYPVYTDFNLCAICIQELDEIKIK